MQSILRGLAVYVFLLIIFRIAGKRTLSRLWWATIGLSVLKQRFPKLDLLLEGAPLILIDQGKLLKDRMDKCRVDEGEILTAARMSQGLSRMDEIEYAILERNGEISIIPKGEK